MKSIDDVFDECDFFAAGGCGDGCWTVIVNEDDFGQYGHLDKGHCKAMEVNWFPDLGG